MKIKVLVFAQLSDALGKSECTLEINEGTTVSEFIQTFLSQSVFESIRNIPLLCAVNEEYFEGKRVLQDQDVVALIPPVAGG